MPVATLYTAITSLTSTASLFASIFLSMRLDSVRLIYANFAFLTGGNLLLLFVGRSSDVWLVVALLLLGFGCSSSVPLLTAFYDQRITLSNSVIALMGLSFSVFVSFNPVLFGRRFEQNPLFFVYVNLAVLLTVVSLFVSLHLMDVWRKRIFARFDHIKD